MWLFLAMGALGADAWVAGAGATVASGNTSTVNTSAFVNGDTSLGPHDLGIRLTGQYGAAGADTNGTGTIADDTGPLTETQRNLGAGVSYALALGRRRTEEGAPEAAAPEGPTPEAPTASPSTPRLPPPAVFVLAAVEHRPTSGMELRPSTAVGVRVHAARNPEVTSYLETGVLVANETYTKAAANLAGTDTNHVLGVFLGHTATWPVALATWTHRVVLTQNVLDTEDLRLDVSGAFDVPVSDTFSFRLGSDLRFDAKPVSLEYRALDLVSGVQLVLHP